MTEVSGSIESLLGERERVRPASAESWRSVEAWLGRELPPDYKDLVDGYGDAVLLGHLFLPHPEGGDPLLTFMQEERRYFHSAYGEVRNIPEPVSLAWDQLVPWAYHDWNGDVCLLVPPPAGGDWTVAVAFRQCPEFLVIHGGVTEFMQLLLEEGKLPRGWPSGGPLWKPMADSPVV
ncbi:SMI1/KNR4 family protein [Streptomyces sp. NPDC001937]|uniref:SMI1/KNR4 family protein n=1 Tax=Streptomyces sp. NPDC057284 TaxID=3346083 RepID=UPI003627DABB